MPHLVSGPTVGISPTHRGGGGGEGSLMGGTLSAARFMADGVVHVMH